MATIEMMIDGQRSRKLAELREAYGSLVEGCRVSQGLKSLLLSRKGELERALQQFSSPIIVVVSMGMLKAGKSTLTNLMARTPDASPVGFGRDTTLRPALIQMAREGEEPALCLFFDAAGNQGDAAGRRARLMASILDRLRGLADGGNSAMGLSERHYALTQENLRQALCSTVGSNAMLYTDPLLVVVKVPYHPEARMLSHNRMLMDMPGLDSNSSGLDLGQYKAVINECDMMIFVQSSVAPLNKQACQYLKEISAVRQAATTWIIQNRMKSRPWLREDVMQRADEQQLRHAQEIVCMESGQSSYAHHWASANLGMAYDALLGKEEERLEGVGGETLLDGSSYKQLEDALVGDLQENGEATRFRHCCDVLSDCCQRVSEDIVSYMGQLEAQREKAGRNEQLLHELKKLLERELALQEDSFPFLPGVAMEEPLERKFSHEFERVLAREEFSILKVQGAKVRGSLVDNYLQCCSRAGKALALRLLKETPLCQLYVGNLRLDSYCNKELKREWEKLRMRAEGLFSAAACSSVFDGLDFPGAGRVDESACLAIAVCEEEFDLPPDALYGRFELNWSWAFWERHIEVRRDIHGRYAWSDVLRSLCQRYAEKVAHVLRLRANAVAARLIRKSMENGVTSFQQRLSEALREVQQSLSALQEEQKEAKGTLAHWKEIMSSIQEIKQD